MAISTASPRGLVEAARYRPNVIVRTEGPGDEENAWAGRDLAIGGEVALTARFLWGPGRLRSRHE
ncbi:hypothetical protein [Actinomadura rugatobispora]|uniref:Uncharacterized protein n=1 Tax=Actinomadura rugatobispora TaxID=1994 RepID=A0ABW1AHY6_9ACTN|nr:hypothetical protein GCM10010200_019840 [Actinomadura rugatobispora]